MCKRATQVTIASDDYDWRDKRRYSNRQKSDMLIGGILGSIEYRGELAEFLPLLEVVAVFETGV